MRVRSNFRGHYVFDTGNQEWGTGARFHCTTILYVDSTARRLQSDKLALALQF
jgi:hypothetical protein